MVLFSKKCAAKLNNLDFIAHYDANSLQMMKSLNLKESHDFSYVARLTPKYV